MINKNILTKISNHRPELKDMIRNISNATGKTIRGFYARSIAKAYLRGMSRLSIAETYELSKIC